MLGTVDRPQLHDIVLEFVLGQWSSDQSQQAHRAIVEHFRRTRPPHGGWLARGMLTNRVVHYVVNEINYHILNAWDKENVLDDATAVSWLSDHVNGSFDAIAKAAVRHIGVESTLLLSKKAEEKSDWWQAALLTTLAAFTIFAKTTSLLEVNVLYKQALSYVNKVVFVPAASEDELFERDALKLVSVLS